mgnify:CR=1 FL=1
MARKTIEQRLAELDAQRATLKARLGKQERANDTRRKVLLGALVLHRLESGKDEEFSRRLREWLKRELPDFLTRPGDKELFADLIANAPADLAYLLAENARLRERVAALEVVAGHVEDAWQDEGVHGEGFVFNLNWLLSVARGGELSPYLKDRAALAGQEQAS